MSDLSLTENKTNQSPFDSIRRKDVDGEYWLARELMPLLGYARWNEFEDVIDRAKAACQNTGNSILQHFSGIELKTKGRPRQDY
jgi:DNA-damage-inducible protein D